MQDLAVVVNLDGYFYEAVDAIIEAGFKKVFVQWYDKETEPTQQEAVDYIKSKGLQIIFAHLGYQNINDIWLDNEEGEALIERYKKNIDEARANGIPMVMMHPCSKFEPPFPSETGLRRFEAIAQYANQLGIEIGFENTKVTGFQRFLIKNLKAKAGVCLDIGHCHAHFKDDFDYDFFRDKITSVHIHDNFGVKDEHLLPFDGNVDWKQAMSDLKRANFDRELTMEILYHRQYPETMTIQQFYKEGYRRGLKLAELFEEA